MSPSSSQRAPLVAFGLVLCAAIAVVFTPTLARAGDYTVPYCVGLDGTPAQVLPDFKSDFSSQAIAAYGCSSADQGMSASIPADSPSGAFARYTLTADGAGMTIVGAGGSGFYSPGNTTVSVGPLAALSSCGADAGPSCIAPRAWSGSWAAPDAPSQRSSLTFDVLCSQATCTGGGLTIKRLAVTFRDDAAPNGGKVTGTLFNSSPGNPLSGPATVSAEVADTGSGARYFAAVIDGNEIARSTPRCDPPYGRQHPCPAGLADSALVDTTKIASGTHQLQIVAVDASGNTSVISTSALIVDNGAPKGPGADPNLRGAAIGSYEGDDARLQVWWPATGRAPSSSKRVKKLCKSKKYARAHKLACVGRPAKDRVTASWSARGTTLLRGRASTPDGQPINGAKVDVLQVPARDGASSRSVAAATTNTKGEFSVRVPVSSGSATFTVRRFARVRDDQPASTAYARRTVRASTTFQVSDRTVRRGQVVTLSGRLKSRSSGLAGNAIAIQANPGGSWRAVTTVRTRKSGRWKAKYRVPSSLRGTYPFRAKIVPSGAYPFSSGVSSATKVTVR